MTTFVPEYGLLPWFLSEAVWYAALVGAGWLSWRVVRAYERRSLEPERLRALTDRVALLEVTLSQVECHVERTVEAQRFTTALLVGRMESRGSTESSGHGFSARTGEARSRMHTE